MVFPVVMYGCESQIITKAECRSIDAFELWCWRRLLRVPWTARRSNQSILKEICPEYSLEGLMLKLKLQYSGHLIWRTDSLDKTLMLGKIEDRRRRGQQRGGWWWHHWLDGHEFEQAPAVGDGQGRLAWCIHGVAKSLTQLSNSTELNWLVQRAHLISPKLNLTFAPMPLIQRGFPWPVPVVYLVIIIFLHSTYP